MQVLMSILLIVLIIAAIAALWFVSASFAADALLRRRKPDPLNPPSNYGIPFQEVEFPSRDGTKLVGWWMQHEKPIGTIILCHGQAGSMDGDTEHAKPLYDAGFNVLMFDFRGHGRSEGKFVTWGMYEKEDLLGALDYLEKFHHIEEVGVLGFSMGAAAAIIAAVLSDNICTLVVDGSFGRLHRTVSAYFTQRLIPKFIAQPFARFMIALASIRMEGRLDHADPVRWTPHLGPRPILFIHGEDDKFVTMQDVDRMASLAPGPVEVWIAYDVGHRGAYQASPEKYNRRVLDWFIKYLPQPKQEKVAVES